MGCDRAVGDKEGRKSVQEKKKYIYHYGKTKGYRGIGFYVKRGLGNNIIEVKGISERVGVFELKIEEKEMLTIIQVYAPTSEKSNEEMEEFYEDVEKALRENDGYHGIQ